MALSPTSPTQQQEIVHNNTLERKGKGGGVNAKGGGVPGLGGGELIENEAVIPRTSSPINCPSTTSSTTSDSNIKYHHVTTSSLTDDNINNDFFYDDEFTGWLLH